MELNNRKRKFSSAGLVGEVGEVVNVSGQEGFILNQEIVQEEELVKISTLVRFNVDPDCNAGDTKDTIVVRAKPDIIESAIAIEDGRQFRPLPSTDIPVVLVTDTDHQSDKVDHAYPRAARHIRYRRHKPVQEPRKVQTRPVYSCRHCKDENVSNEHFKEPSHLRHLAACHNPRLCLSQYQPHEQVRENVDVIRGTLTSEPAGVKLCYNEMQPLSGKPEVKHSQLGDRIIAKVMVKDGKRIVRASLPEAHRAEKTEWFENKNVHTEKQNPWPTELHYFVGNDQVVDVAGTDIDLHDRKDCSTVDHGVLERKPGLTIDGKPIQYKEKGGGSCNFMVKKVHEVRIQPFPFGNYKEVALLCLIDAQTQIPQETLREGAKPGMTAEAMAKWAIENLAIDVSEERMKKFIETDLMQINSFFKCQSSPGGEMVWTLDWEEQKVTASTFSGQQPKERFWNCRKFALLKHLRQIRQTFECMGPMLNDHIKGIDLRLHGLEEV